MTYRVKGLSPEPFKGHYHRSDSELADRGITRCTVDACPGFPDRVTMEDVPVGETVLLLNYEHMPVDSPYRSRHAIFVREGAVVAYDEVDAVPDVMKRRLIALRGFDTQGFMIDADVAEGEEIEPVIRRFFANPDIEYIHAHNAIRGCFSGLIERA